MDPVINVEESPGKTVGRRRASPDPISGGWSRADARAWRDAFQTGRIPKGVYRFESHEAADEWLWMMLTREERS